MVRLEKKELIYASVGTIVILAWFLYVRDLIAPSLQAMPPILATILYQLGLLVGLYFLSRILHDKKMRWKAIIIFFIIFLGADLVSAPYIVTKAGTLTTSVDFWYVSTDGGIGSLYSGFLPASWLYVATYVVTPVIFLLLIPIIVWSPKQIAKALGW